MATTYTNDIKPMIRPQDQTCPGMVARGIRVGDADWMCDPGPSYGYADHGNAQHVWDRLSDASMPPDGPWTPAQMNVYQKWMADGYQK
jgi:hypothetical protein